MEQDVGLVLRTELWGVASLIVEASGVEDLLADCVGSQPILTQVEWGKLKVQLPSNYATLLRLV